MSLKGKKIALFLDTLYNEMEFWYPFYRMKEEGAEVVVIASKKGTYTSKIEMPATADTDIRSVNPDDFSALIIPGGYAPDHMRRVPEMVNFMKSMHENGKV